MSDPTQLGPEQPVEDVLEQRREDGEPADDQAVEEPPEEVPEADYAEQRIELPEDDDAYPGAPG